MIAAPSTRSRLLSERHLLVALFATVATVVLARHEMWMDELNPWVIARDAHSLRELFFNMRFEPHPALLPHWVPTVRKCDDASFRLPGAIAASSK